MRTALTIAAATLALVSSTVASTASGIARLPDGGIDPSVLTGVDTVHTGYRRHRDRGTAPMTVRAARRAGFRPVQQLVGGAYPAFSPGIGAVYAKRGSLPLGPYLAFDHKGRQVSTIYKFPLGKMNDHQTFEADGVSMPPMDRMKCSFAGSHPGADFPHYNCVFWHVPKTDVARVAD